MKCIIFILVGLPAVNQALLAENNALRVNGTRLNEQLQTFGKISAEVAKDTSRLAYSETDIVGRAYIFKRMQAACCS